MINKETIRRWWDVFVGEGNFTEVRILGRFQYSGYFKSLDNLIAQVEPYSNMDDEQIYFVLNKIDDACYCRQQSERIVKSPKTATTDGDIVRRLWVMVDFDPIRKSGVNASNEEYEYAHKKAQEVYIFLREKGFGEPVICKSGNGIHLNYKIDLPADEETKDIIKRFFLFLGQKFSDDKVEVDPKNFNEARLCKLYSTVAKKGANLPDRPWRESEILYVPDNITTTPIEKFKELADLIPKEEKQKNPTAGIAQGSFDLDSWLNAHAISYRVKTNGSSTVYELEQCPWIDNHSDHKKWDCALFKDANGKITFNCHHSHCNGKTWRDFRLFYEPDAYIKQQQYIQRQQQYSQQQRQYAQKQKYEIKEELPELGGKWLSMSDITKIDISSLEKVKTGFDGIDSSILGLIMSEVTLLSGSNSSGKSSWLNSLLLNIIQQGYKCALWSGELRPDILKAWIQMVAAGAHNLTPSKYGDGKYYVSDAKANKIDQWLDGKFFLYNNEYGCQWEQIFHDMQELLKAGVKVFALDNLFSLNIDLLGGDKNEKQKELILQIKNFAKKNKVHIILVAHPRKVMTFLRKNDISGSSDLTNAVDNVLIIHRINRDFNRAGEEFFGQQKINELQSYGNVIEIAKNRMFGSVDVLVGMHYESESRRFLNSKEERLIYGWEEPPVQSCVAFEQTQSQYYPSDSYGLDDLSPIEDTPF